MDFISIKKVRAKNHSKNRDDGTITVAPDFQVMKSKDLMVRGRSFYAIWDEEEKRWIKDELEVPRLIDREVMKTVNELKAEGENVIYSPVRDYSSGHWTKYVSFIKNMPDNYHQLDSKIFFANDEPTQTDYSTHKLPYAYGEGDISSYDELMSTLYDPEERQKLEWAVGAIFTGDSKKIQKFIVLYGSAGSGKSTFLNIVQKLVEGYYITFNAKDLVGFDSFGTEVFKNNPLVAIQHDGDLSKIEDNSILNSIISHEEVIINEKHKSKYSMRINCFLFMGTNKPVKISDSKSGLIRRLIDVSPSGRKLSIRDYNRLVKNIDFELGAIAAHCIKVYNALGPNYYNAYRPKTMMFETNVLYNFVEEYYLIFCNEDGFQLRQLYDMYKQFCLDTGEQYPMKRNVFRAEMKTYFREFYEQRRIGDKVMRSYFCGFRKDLIDGEKTDEQKLEPEKVLPDWLKLKDQPSILDDIYKDCPAQLANDKGTPKLFWSNCKTLLKDINTRDLHYILLPENHIVIDFDLKDAEGNKNADLNLQEAAKWPETYAEYSKGGGGIHLHYIYTGNVSDLKRIYAEGVEIKVFTGKASLRRKLTKCNNHPIATISSGLPLREKKGGSEVLNQKTVADENHLRVMIKKCLNKEFHGATKPECDFIFKLLEEAYNNGVVYDVSDMRSAVLAFACQSSHQSAYCVDLVSKMKWASEKETSTKEADGELAFYDVEVFKNLLLVCYKFVGKECVSLINPTPQQIGEIFNFKLIGFNNRRYDNHILYARYIGYTNEQLFNLSQKLISKESVLTYGFREAYNISYTDVYDFASEKKSLKQWEIDLGIHHKEFEFNFNESLPEKYWPLAIEYCCNDVKATEIVFNERKADFLARCILADLAGGTPNDTTNQLTTKIVFGDDKNPQLNYVHLEETFPGYEFVRGTDGKMHNMYRGTDVGFGGYVYAEPGMYDNVALLDIESMHPTSIIEMNYFGRYTKNYADLKEARLAIKHGDFDKARTMLGGKLAKYLEDTSKADDLSYALKIALNSAYGLTSASFINPMKDSRNVNNIVALRGALFMRTLQDEIQNRGYRVVHIKTDSIKIPDATEEIIAFCKSFAQKYGYKFAHEATYEKMCLVNDAVYIAKYAWAEKAKNIGKWTATGAQFAEPYIFKKFFSKEEVIFEDYIQKKSVTNPASIYLDFDENLPDVSVFEKEQDIIRKLLLSKKEIPDDEVDAMEKRLVELRDLIAKGHNYYFVGRVGAFVPVIDGVNGGKLYRVKDGSYSALAGTKGYRWKEAEVVKELNQEDQLDISYYHKMAGKAIAAISKFGDFYEFAELDHPDAPSDINEDLIGFDEIPHLAPVAQAVKKNKNL